MSVEGKQGVWNEDALDDYFKEQYVMGCLFRT